MFKFCDLHFYNTMPQNWNSVILRRFYIKFFVCKDLYIHARILHLLKYYKIGLFWETLLKGVLTRNRYSFSSLAFDYNILNQPKSFRIKNGHRSYSFEYVLIKGHQLFLRYD